MRDLKIEPPVLPIDFIRSVLDGVENTLYDWLKANTPDEIRTLFEDYAVFSRYLANSMAEATTTIDNDDIFPTLVGAMRIMVHLDRSFYSQGDGGELVPFKKWLRELREEPA